MEKYNSSGPVILLVDDNPQNLQVLGKLLQEEKYKIEFALNGESTLEWLKNKQFDLILLDLHMPGMNGFEVCKRIRSDKTTCEIPIIFLSAESERESILKGFEVVHRIMLPNHLTAENCLQESRLSWILN